VIQGGALTAEKAGELKYLEAVCKETLRLMPPTGGGFRIMDTTVEVMGYTFPKVHDTFFLPCYGLTISCRPSPHCF
jgi:cytochrome P450